MLVTTETSLTAVPTPRSRMPPRAVSVTATCTLGSSSTRAAPPGPDQSPVSTSTPSMKMPSVDDQPGVRPPALTRCAISRVVVVLPLVPVTATTGIDGPQRPDGLAGVVAGQSRPAPRRARTTGSMPWAVIAANALATASPNSSAVPRCRNG